MVKALFRPTWPTRERFADSWRAGNRRAVVASYGLSLLGVAAATLVHTEPRYTFFVADPDEWLALLLFLLTAVVTGQLAAGQRRRAEEAEEHERQARADVDALATAVERW
jgi:K+-sensing histidine kinase KdpD